MAWGLDQTSHKALSGKTSRSFQVKIAPMVAPPRVGFRFQHWGLRRRLCVAHFHPAAVFPSGVCCLRGFDQSRHFIDSVPRVWRTGASVWGGASLDSHVTDPARAHLGTRSGHVTDPAARARLWVEARARLSTPRHLLFALQYFLLHSAFVLLLYSASNSTSRTLLARCHKGKLTHTLNPRPQTVHPPHTGGRPSVLEEAVRAREGPSRRTYCMLGTSITSNKSSCTVGVRHYEPASAPRSTDLCFTVTRHYVLQ